MDANFWHSRWSEGRIGFHEGVVNRHLARFWKELQLDLGSTVLVPLCGKTVDLVALHGMGHEVVGVELSDLACRAFFDEQDLPFDVLTHDEHSTYRGVDAGAGITIWRGDIMTAPIQGEMDALFDRAALIALPPERRKSYVDRIANQLRKGARGILVSIDYPANEKAGPPFTVPNAEVLSLLSTDFEVELLDDQDVLEHEGAAKRWGLTALREQVYKLEKR